MKHGLVEQRITIAGAGSVTVFADSRLYARGYRTIRVTLHPANENKICGHIVMAKRGQHARARYYVAAIYLRACGMVLGEPVPIHPASVLSEVRK